MTDEEAKEICEKIRQIAYALHVYLGVGFLVNFGSYRFECQKFVLRNAMSRRIDGV